MEYNELLQELAALAERCRYSRDRRVLSIALALNTLLGALHGPAQHLDALTQLLGKFASEMLVGLRREN